MRTLEEFQAEFEATDWDAIDDQNRLRNIGCELYENAAFLDKTQPKTLGIVAGIMDGFSVNVPNRMRRHDGRFIAEGFARAMVRAEANAAYNDEEDGE